MAFDRDVAGEIAFYTRCFKRFSPSINVKRVLEPACGTGVFLLSFPMHGYAITGYDLSDAMVEYAKNRISAEKLDGHATAVVGNMKDARFPDKFDAAIIGINSLGYMRLDKDITSHFKSMASSLVDGALYIVEIIPKCDDITSERRVDESWHVEGDGVELELSWSPNYYDVEHRIRHVDFKMFVRDHGRCFSVEEAHELRLWLHDEFVALARAGGFELAAIFNQAYEEIPAGTRITGELGVLYYVLKKTSTP